MQSVTTKTVTLPDDHWAVLEQEALFANIPPDKLLAHAVRLMQTEAQQARLRSIRGHSDAIEHSQREASRGLPVRHYTEPMDDLRVRQIVQDELVKARLLTVRDRV